VCKNESSSVLLPKLPAPFHHGQDTYVVGPLVAGLEYRHTHQPPAVATSVSGRRFRASPRPGDKHARDFRPALAFLPGSARSSHADARSLDAHSSGSSSSAQASKSWATVPIARKSRLSTLGNSMNPYFL